jgi:hypothetical protein
MRVRRAQDVFSKCPGCESPNLIHMDGDSICTYCGWDSIELRTEAFFGPRQEPLTVELSAEKEDQDAVAASRMIYGVPLRGYGSSVA